MIEIDEYALANAYREDLIKEIAPKLGLAPLPMGARPEEFELRLWTNLGALGDPRLIGLRSSNGKNEAYLFEVDRRADRVKPRRESLGVPKSGWSRLMLELRNQLTTPRGLTRDPNFQLQRDEPVILLEVLEKGEYRRVFYGQRTSYPDGERLVKVAGYLENEFSHPE